MSKAIQKDLFYCLSSNFKFPKPINKKNWMTRRNKGLIILSNDLSHNLVQFTIRVFSHHNNNTKAQAKLAHIQPYYEK